MEIKYKIINIDKFMYGYIFKYTNLNDYHNTNKEYNFLMKDINKYLVKYKHLFYVITKIINLIYGYMKI
jgi:hypothetical protein